MIFKSLVFASKLSFLCRKQTICFKMGNFGRKRSKSLFEYHFQGAEKEWGDGIRGLYLTTARYALYQIPKTKIHTKNYRPQLLVFLEFDENKEIINPEIISVARQLKAGKGLRNGFKAFKSPANKIRTSWKQKPTWKTA